MPRKASATWKPDRAEAQFLGEVLSIDVRLAEIARNMLEKGIPLREVIATYKDAVKIATTLGSAS